MTRLAAAACVVLGLIGLATGLYGIAAPAAPGHYGFHVAEYAAAVRYLQRTGEWFTGYLHFPVLTQDVATLPWMLLGEHEYAIRAAGLSAFVGSFVLLVTLVWRFWGAWYGVLAGLVYVLLPIDIWFGSHTEPAQPSIFALLAFFVCYLRWINDGQWWAGALALASLLVACGLEWEPYLAAAPIGIHALVVGVRRRGRFLTFVPLFALVVLLPFILQLVLIHALDVEGEVLRHTHKRIGDLSYRTFLTSIWDNARVMFGAPILCAVLAWVVSLAYRLRRGLLRARDLIGVSFLFALIVFANVFQSAFVIHHYCLFYGNIVCCIAIVDLAELAGSWSMCFFPSAPSVVARAPIALLVVAVMSGPAWHALIESRLKGGWPGATGSLRPDYELVATAEASHELLGSSAYYYIHPSVSAVAPSRWRDGWYEGSIQFHLDTELRPAGSFLHVSQLEPNERRTAAVLYRPDHLNEQEANLADSLARQHPLLRVGHYAMLDLSKTGASLRREHIYLPSQSWLERYLVGPYPRPIRVRDR
jgi:hypothetical protein